MSFSASIDIMLFSAFPVSGSFTVLYVPANFLKLEGPNFVFWISRDAERVRTKFRHPHEAGVLIYKSEIARCPPYVAKNCKSRAHKSVRPWLLIFCNIRRTHIPVNFGIFYNFQTNLKNFIFRLAGRIGCLNLREYNCSAYILTHCILEANCEDLRQHRKNQFFDVGPNCAFGVFPSWAPA